ncbi:MAG: hypothetical protein ACOZFS_02570 [Thermodesulfobacteriota bacterium]
MVPTLAVILLAYGMYALFSFILQRKGGHPRNRSQGSKLSGFALMGGVVGLGLILCFWLAPDKTEQRLKLAGFLGTVYAEGWPDRLDRVEFPPVKAQNPGGGEQPVYALLHPETPAGQIEPEKKFIRPRPIRAAKKSQPTSLQDKSGKSAKVAKILTPASKKDKSAVKGSAKKKKRSTALKTGQTNAG